MSFRIDSLFTCLSILPLLVFLAETCVVTLSTVRTICIARGRKVLAASLGFFEVSIWLFAIGQIMQNLSDLGCYIAFASGFSLGNFLGVIIEGKLALGNVAVQVTSRKNASELIESLKIEGYGVTTLDAQGATGPVQVVLTIIKRKELENVISIVKHFDPRAFYSINDLQSAAKGIFPDTKNSSLGIVPSLLRFLISARVSNPRPASTNR